MPSENIIVGCGADEGDTTNINIFLKCECVTKLIDLIFRVVLEPGDCIINTPPTFGMYAFDCCVNGAYF